MKNIAFAIQYIDNDETKANHASVTNEVFEQLTQAKDKETPVKFGSRLAIVTTLIDTTELVPNL